LDEIRSQVVTGSAETGAILLVAQGDTVRGAEGIVVSDSPIYELAVDVTGIQKVL